LEKSKTAATEPGVRHPAKNTTQRRRGSQRRNKVGLTIRRQVQRSKTAPTKPVGAAPGGLDSLPRWGAACCARPYKGVMLFAGFSGGDGCGGGFLVGGVGFEFFVGAFEVLDVAAAKVPDAGGDFVDDVFVVADEEHGAFEFL
jgi:hypothetical protein